MRLISILSRIPSSLLLCRDRALPYLPGTQRRHPGLGRMMVASRVLLVEDEFLVRSVLADELRDQGYEVVEAETGDRAAQLLECKSFDVLLTDVRMPGKLDGIDLAHRARSARPTLPVLVVSGYAEQISTRLASVHGSDRVRGQAFSANSIRTYKDLPC